MISWCLTLSAALSIDMKRAKANGLPWTVRTDSTSPNCYKLSVISADVRSPVPRRCTSKLEYCGKASCGDAAAELRPAAREAFDIAGCASEVAAGQGEGKEPSAGCVKENGALYKVFAD